jgi:hypothetical protein
MRGAHEFTRPHQTAFITRLGRDQRLDEFQHPFILSHRMPGGTRHAVAGIRLHRRHRVIMILVFGQELRSENGFRDLRLIDVELFRREFGEVIERRATGAGADVVDDLFAHEGAHAHIAVGIAPHGVAHHGIDAQKPVPGGTSTSPTTEPGRQRI